MRPKMKNNPMRQMNIPLNLKSIDLKEVEEVKS